MRAWPLIALLACLLDERGAPATRHLEGVRTATPSLLETDPRAMEALEDAGLSLAQILGARGRSNDALAKTAVWSTLVATVEADIRQLEARPGIADLHPRKRFQMSWLSEHRARFELVAAVNRLDRTFLDPTTCGEARLVYRLVIAPDGRPPSSLPMTLSVSFPQPKRSPGGGGTPSCAPAAQDWLDLPPDGARRVQALAALYARLPGYAKVEINLQTFHGTTLAAVYADGSGYDDHAEYLLRTFDRIGDALVPRLLVGTPRFDLDEEEKRALAAWIRDNFESIDGGNWVIPDRFLARRALSVTPRSFARTPNRVFKHLFGDGAAFADLPYDKARLARSPVGLLRRLDQGTCEGCHETRSVAGFHMLGESRTPEAHFDAVAMPRSAHLDIELDWREAMTAAVAQGASFDAPRPFAERKRAGPGRAGSHCAVNDDPTFAGWTCARGLVCHPSGNDDVGTCAYATPTGVGMGDPCQDVTLGPETAADGAFVDPKPMSPCAFGDKPGTCDPNLLGFPGGMCVTDCPVLGALARDGELICGQLPAAGYENECFVTQSESIEKCIARHLNNRVLRTCGEKAPCRDDYACARTVGLPPKTGVCVSTYGVYGLRVDGPILDR
ncbi:MAG TPA: hypothetical protein VLT33_10905 [Labilithrix sp.]|nr:hypothetical protein [Labilithrix sp.]